MMWRVPRLLISIGILLVAFAIGTAYFQHPDSVYLPPRLNDLPIHHRLQGPAATEAFRNLHRQRLPLSAGAVGYYGNEGEATLWVARAPYAWLAGRMVAAIWAEIAECDKDFHPAGERTHLGHRIHEATGRDQTHFYYQAGRLIVWLSSDPDMAEETLARVLEVYR